MTAVAFLQKAGPAAVGLLGMCSFVCVKVC